MLLQRAEYDARTKRAYVEFQGSASAPATIPAVDRFLEADTAAMRVVQALSEASTLA